MKAVSYIEDLKREHQATTPCLQGAKAPTIPIPPPNLDSFDTARVTNPTPSRPDSGRGSSRFLLACFRRLAACLDVGAQGLGVGSLPLLLEMFLVSFALVAIADNPVANCESSPACVCLAIKPDRFIFSSCFAFGHCYPTRPG